MISWWPYLEIMEYGTDNSVIYSDIPGGGNDHSLVDLWPWELHLSTQLVPLALAATSLSRSLTFLEHWLCAEHYYGWMVYILHLEKARVILNVYTIVKDQQG